MAIAGVLAMKPHVLILDEPTAGLDPKGRDEILDRVAQLHREHHMTIILVSHSMEDVAKYVDRLYGNESWRKRCLTEPQERSLDIIKNWKRLGWQHLKSHIWYMV